MAHGAVTVTEETPARDIARLMFANNIKRVPVVRDGRLVGIVARSDLVRALAEKLEEKSDATPSPAPSVDEALRRGRSKAAK